MEKGREKEMERDEGKRKRKLGRLKRKKKKWTIIYSDVMTEIFWV